MQSVGPAPRWRGPEAAIPPGLKPSSRPRCHTGMLGTWAWEFDRHVSESLGAPGKLPGFFDLSFLGITTCAPQRLLRRQSNIYVCSSESGTQEAQ